MPFTSRHFGSGWRGGQARRPAPPELPDLAHRLILSLAEEDDDADDDGDGGGDDDDDEIVHIPKGAPTQADMAGLGLARSPAFHDPSHTFAIAISIVIDIAVCNNQVVLQ